MKQYADKRQHTKETDIQLGDKVLVKNQLQGKLDTFYRPQPYLVIERKGTQVTAKGRRITRNISFFKKVPVTMTPRTTYDHNDNDIDIELDNDDNTTRHKARRYPLRTRNPPQRLGEVVTH